MLGHIPGSAECFVPQDEDYRVITCIETPRLSGETTEG